MAWDCYSVESGASVASVGCPEGMQAVSVGCGLFSAGFFLPALGATGIVQGDSASCAFPPRDILEPEWSTFPYAIVLSCAWNKPAAAAASSGSGSARASAASTAAAAASVPPPARTSAPDTLLKVQGKLVKKRGF